MKRQLGERLKFNAQYYPQFQSGEKNSGRSIVDPTGYVDAKTRIENLMRAGERLDESRRELYQYGPDDEDDGYTNPLMEQGLDLSDVHRMRRDAMRRLASAALKPQETDASETKPKLNEAEAQATAKPADSVASNVAANGVES